MKLHVLVSGSKRAAGINQITITRLRILEIDRKQLVILIGIPVIEVNFVSNQVNYITL